MIYNTTIWTQTNLAQWAENSNRGSWYKYTQASRSFSSYIKSKITTSANLASTIEGKYTPVESWVEVDTTQWVHVDRKQWLDLFRGYKSLLISIFPESKNDILNLKSILKSIYLNNYDLLLTIYGGYNSLLNLAAVIRSISVEITSWTDHYKSQWLSDDKLQWVDFLLFSKELSVVIKGFGNQNIDLLSVLQVSRNLYSNLGVYIIQGFISSIDLSGYLKTKESGYNEFIKVIRGWGKENINLLKCIKGTEVLYSNLGSFLRGKDLYTLFDLSKYIKSTEVIYTSFIKSIRGWGKDNRNLGGYTKLFISNNVLNFLEYIKSTEIVYKDIGSYLQTIPPLNLLINIGIIEPLNLSAYLRVDDRVKWLHVYITSFQERSISASITPFHIFNLNVHAIPIPSVNISAYLYGWAKKDLGSFILARKWPDLIVNIVPVPSVNLKAMIAVYKAFGVELNLNIIIGSVRPINLSCYLSTVQPVNLNMILIPSGQIYDLNMQIKPKVIFMKAIIYVALLEHIDLNMLINNGCIFSMYKNLPIYFNTLYCKQLLVYIQPKLGTNLIGDLGIEINNNEYIVTDSIDVSFFTGRVCDVYNILKIEYYSPHMFIVEDTITLCFSKYFSKDLKAVLQCVLESSDLSMSIRPISLSSYKFSPEWVDLTNKRIVMNIDKIYEQWRRIVELFFDTGPKDDYSLKYIYVDGLQKAFKEDRNRFWQVVVTSHLPNPGQELPQKLNIRSKHLIKLSDFSTVDEAVKYLIDMVSYPRSINLRGVLNVIEIPKLDLQCYLSVDFKYRWSKNLNNIIIGDYVEFNLPLLLKCGYNVINNFLVATKSFVNGTINLQNRIGYISAHSFLQMYLKSTIANDIQLMFVSKALHKKYYNLITTIRYYYGNFDLVNAIKSKESNIEKNLISNLTSIGYIVPDSTNIVFNFTDANYVPPEYNDLDFNFII